MGRALGALLEVISRSPATPQNTFLGVLVKALFVELGTQIAAVNATGAAAAFGHRRDAGVRLQVGSVSVTLALRPQRSAFLSERSRPMIRS